MPQPGWRAVADSAATSSISSGPFFATLDAPGNPRLWDKPIINGQTPPGLWKLISGPEPELRLQSGKASGNDGGEPTIRGNDAPDVVFEVWLLNNREWQDMQPILRLLSATQRKPAGGRRVPVQFYHPMLAAFEYTNVFLKKMTPKGPSGGGPIVIRISFIAVAPASDAKAHQAKAQPIANTVQTIPIAGQTPNPPNLRDTARKPYQNAR